MAEELSLYKRRIADGLCGSCGKEAIEPGRSLGPVCTQKGKEAAARKKAKKKAAGKCLGSGCHNVPESGTWCDACKKLQAADRKKRTEKKREAGVCVSSGCKNEAKEGCSLCQSCIAERSEVSSEHYYRRKEVGLCRSCNNPPGVAGGSMCEYHQEKYADYRLQVKLEVMEAYGGAFCAVCNETDLDMLHIDHIEGGGGKHRQSVGTTGGHDFYLYLRREGYPQTPRLRVLCSNHNTKAHRESLRGRR